MMGDALGGRVMNMDSAGDVVTGWIPAIARLRCACAIMHGVAHGESASADALRGTPSNPAPKPDCTKKNHRLKYMPLNRISQLQARCRHAQRS